jgi:hypothetical protein
MKKTIRTALLAGLAAVFAGCNSSGGSGPENAQDFCQQAIQLETAKAEYCDARFYDPYIVQAFIDCTTFQESQDAGRVAFDRAQASACLAALEEMSCVEYMMVDIGSFAGLPAECRAAMAPRVATGDPCYSQLGYECSGYCDMDSGEGCFIGGTCRDYVAFDGDCSADQRCGPGLRCNGSVCEDAPVVAVLGEGGDCSVEYTICDDPYYCCENAAECTVGTCVARKTAGADCLQESECLHGLQCRSTGGPPTCEALLAEGAECTGGDCAQGLYCDAGYHCARHPRLGESCAEPESEDLVWCEDSWCDGSGETPTCAAFLEPGAPCMVDSAEEFFRSCGPGLYCVPTFAGPPYGTCGRLYCIPET